MKKIKWLGIALAACLSCGLFELQAQDTVRMIFDWEITIDWRTVGGEQTLVADFGNGRREVIEKGHTFQINVEVDSEEDLGGDTVALYSQTSFEALFCSGPNSNGAWLKLNVSGCQALDSLICEAGRNNGPYYPDLDLDASGCTALTYLDVQGCMTIKSLNVTDCMALKYLSLSFFCRQPLDLSGYTALEYLATVVTSSVDVSGCTALKYLECSTLSSVDVSGCTALKYLECRDGSTSLDISDCTALEYLYSNTSGLISRDWKDYPALTYLSLGGERTSLDVSGCPALEYLECNYNQLTVFDVSGCPALTHLDCSSNDLVSLDVSGCPALTYLDCSRNDLASLDISGCPVLDSLDCSQNGLESLALGGCASLKFLNCGGDGRGYPYGRNNLSSLDVSGCPALEYLECNYNQLTVLDVSGCPALETLKCDGTPLTSLDVSACPALEYLSCGFNQLTTLDVSACPALRYLYCDGNGLASLDVSAHLCLEELMCGNNYMESLNVSGCPALKYLDCGGRYNGSWNQTIRNSLTVLNVSGCPALETLVCRGNRLTTLDMSACPVLKNLQCDRNDQLATLDVSGCPVLEYLDCRYTALTSLNLSKNKLLGNVYSDYCNLTGLDCDSIADGHISTEGNRRQGIWDAKPERFDLSVLPDFDVQRASNWRGGRVEEHYLICERDTVYYDYRCKSDGYLRPFSLRVKSGDADLSGWVDIKDRFGRRGGMVKLVSGVYDYSLNLNYKYDRIYIWASGHIGATVAGDGGHDLQVGDNNIELVVTAENGTQKTYTFRIRRLADAALRSLTVSEGDMKPAFSPEVYDYSVEVPYAPDSLEVMAEARHSGAIVSGAGKYGLKVGTNNIEVVVTAEDGTQQAYKLSVIRERLLSSDAALRSLMVSDGDLTPDFSPEVYDYSVVVPYATDSLEVMAEARHDSAKVSGSGKYGLQVGENKMEIVVTAEDGTQKTYTFRIRRLADASLRSLMVSDGDLTPDFSPEVYDYSVTVPYATDSLEVVAEARHDSATVSGTGKYGLEVGENDIAIVVTAEDGTQQTYTLSVMRKERVLSSDAALRSLTVSDGYLIPAFSPEVYDYEIENLHHATDSLEVVAEARHSGATVSGTGKYDLHVGENHIEIVVTAEDGTRQTYMLSVIRERLLSSDAALRSLMVSDGYLIPAFSPEVYDYEIENLHHATDSLEVVAEARHDSATVSGTGKYGLHVGENKVEIVVTAEDGTQSVYRLRGYWYGTAVEPKSDLLAVRVYAREGAIYLSREIGELAVYTASGLCVYRGEAVVIPVPQAGLYVVRSLADGCSWKVVVR